MPRSHTSRDFEAELRELRAHSLAMGARCERSLQLALQAFWEGSKEMAAEVMSRRARAKVLRFEAKEIFGAGKGWV